MKKLICMACLCMLMLSAKSQDERQKKLDQIRTELNDYLKKQLPLPADPATEKKIQQSMAASEVKDTAATGKERYNQLKAFYVENQFWAVHPDYKNFATKKNVGSMANLCANGGFESGNTLFTHNAGAFIGGGSNNCSYASTLPFNPTLPTSATNTVPHRMDIVTNQFDPRMNNFIRTVHGGNQALKLSSHVNTTGISCNINFFSEVDMASVTFRVDQRVSTLGFWYAVGFLNSNHNDNNGGNPFFTARLRDEVTGAVQTICVDPAQINLLDFDYQCLSSFGTYQDFKQVYQPWRYASFNLMASYGHDVTLEFIAADCNQNGHYGYAYIDDICTSATDNATAAGAVSITSSDACFTDGYQFSGTYTMPQIAGATLQSLTVNLRRNGANVGLPITTSITNGIFTGTVPYSMLTPGNSYDITATARFITNGRQLVAFNEIVAGINNDFRVLAVNCCQPPRTGSPGFTISSGIFSTVRRVNVAATDLQTANHWWALMETSQQGNVSDAATIGQVGAIQSGMGLTNSLFNITDNCKAYYIKHGIWLDGCFPFQELRLPLDALPGISNNFNFEDQYNEPRNGFCLGEDIYLDARTSTGANAYLINILRKPHNSNAAYTPFASIGQAGGNLSNRLNLSQILATQNPPLFFEAGYTYQVSLFLSTAIGCNSASVKTDTFRLTCCTQTADARFGLTGSAGPASPYSINASQLNQFTGPYTGATHQWVIASSPNAQNGPFTVLAQTNQSNFTFAYAQIGLYYFVLHRVFTACGNYCYAQIITKNAAGLVTTTDKDCSRINEIWNICDVPVNTRNNCRNNTIGWDAVPGVNSYEIEITLNDPACCTRPTAPPAFASYTSSSNIFNVPANMVNTCFSWRVRVVCSGGRGRWTRSLCNSCNPLIATPVEIITPPKVKGQ